MVWPYGRSLQWTSIFALLLTLCSLFNPGEMVKRENFKTCDQSGFCRRNRAYADAALQKGSAWEAPYRLDPKSLKLSQGQLTGTVLKDITNLQGTVRLPLTITFLESGTVRVTVDEEKRQKGDIDLRHGSKARKERYNEAQNWSIVGGMAVSKQVAISPKSEAGTTKVVYGLGNTYEAVVTHSPFGIKFLRDGEIQMEFNGRGLMNVEHWRPKVEKEKKEGEEAVAEEVSKEANEDESTWWEESFGGNTDTKPRGPESVALDISFPGYAHVFGIPEHAGPMSLKETRGGEDSYDEPYRMYNADVFEYEVDTPMTLYGSIPFMQAHKKGSTVGVLWLNAAETWVDIVKAKTAANKMSMGIAGHITTQTHWFSESGLLDVFVLHGPSPRQISKTYGELTGYSQMPQEFAIAYHQCRWNYVTDDDVKDVDRKFDRHRIPYDVIWLDLDYTDGKKYFTFDPLAFPDPLGMQKQLDEHDRKLVTLIDPHIKIESGYEVIDELKSKDLAVKNKDGNNYDGWCWPGSSHWIDAFNPASIPWWTSWFKFDRFKGSTRNTFIWNDMNEPSVFNGPETTMPKDNLHHGDWEHRDVHNINGMTFQNATYQALIERGRSEGGRRPFVLTRAFFAGSQRLGAMWTGDNTASWDHLAAAIPMILNNGIAGFPFAGADVGGFFGNPSKELLTRWYQAGAFYPFFRAHAHLDTRRREPYLAGHPYQEIITEALRLRYSLLPAWYTAFHAASVNGTPIVRPNYYVHPDDEKGFEIDDQLYLGNTGLLTKPVVTEGADKVEIYLSDDEPYYDYFTYEITKGHGHHTISAPLEKLPLLMQSGHIFPRRDRPRRSSRLMRFDPYTLVIALDSRGGASGEIYVDDGETFDYRDGAFIHRRFVFDSGTMCLTSTDLFDEGSPRSKRDAYLGKMKDVRVERIVVVGAPQSWRGKASVKIGEQGGKESARWRETAIDWVEGGRGKANWAVVKDPRLGIARGWRIDFG